MTSIITVSYKTTDYVTNMLVTLLAHCSNTPMEVFVVINGDGTDVEPLRLRFPTVKFIISEKNLGFAGGNNLAIKQATGEYILLVNPDVIFTDNAVQAIQDRMDRDRDVGIGGISLKNPDGSQQDCVWKFPTPVDQLLLMLKIPHALPNLPPIRQYLMKNFDYSQTQNVDQVMGAFFCIRREVINAIGPLDDGFFMWYEEVDFAKRAKNAGWITKYYHDVNVRHKGAGSFRRVGTLKKQAMIRKSLRRYMKKHFGFGAWFLFTLLDPLFVILGGIAAILKPF